MKRIWIVGVLCVAAVGNVRAQFFNNFFDQQSAHLKNLEQQIAETEVYIKDIEKCYSVVESGLQTIQGITNGEFNLHSTFFASLESINPSVANMAEVAEIMALQVSIVEQCSKALKVYQASPYLHSNEVNYINQVFQTVLQDGINDLNDLTTLITANQAKMGDGERIQRIQGLDADMQRKNAFMQDFTGQTDLLCAQRQQAQGDDQAVLALYGLP
jgi:hypothetical protein